MRKSLRNALTGSIMLTVFASMVVVTLCLLLGTMRYSSVSFRDDVASVFTEDVLTELNSAASGMPGAAASSVQQTVEAYTGKLRIGAGREYAIWDSETGELLGGSQDDLSVTDNVITAMNGEIGDKLPFFASHMDIAIPLTGETGMVIDIMDDASAARALCGRIVLLMLIGMAVSLLMSLAISRILSGSLAKSAAINARRVREKEQETMLPSGDWEAMAVALGATMTLRKHAQGDMLERVKPYLDDGFVSFETDGGAVTEMNENAQKLLSVTYSENLTFDKVFRGVPMPDASQSMVHGRFTQRGRRLDVVFMAVNSEQFLAIVRPEEGYQL